MRDSDESLLLSFAVDRDEAAFRLLADRYLGLIFHTALRRTGNRALAEEISQNILCAIAGKASSLAKNPGLLPAWLHRATLFESSKAMRSESSHQRRKQLQHPDSIPATAQQESSPWSEAVPHLDVALDKLSESDRAVLLLHFFDNRPLPAIARSLGKNPAAVQKQSQRALAKLGRILRGRGVVLSGTALAAGLTGELAKAAPPAFLQSATTAVLTGAATYSTTGLTLMLLSKSKALIPLALLLFAVPLALQQIAISKVRYRNDSLRANLLLASQTDPAAGNRRVPVAGGRSGISRNTDIYVLLEEQKEVLRLGGLRGEEFEKKLAAIDPETLVRLIGEGTELRVYRQTKGYLLGSLVSALAEKDARLAVTTAVDRMESSRSTAHAFANEGTLPDQFAIWAEKDPASAKTWVEEKMRSGKFDNPSSADGMIAAEFRSRLVAAMIAGQTPGLREFLLELPDQERARLVMTSIQGLDSLSKEGSSVSLANYIPVIRACLAEQEREAAWVQIGQKLPRSFRDEYAEAARFFDKAEMTPIEKGIVARTTAESVVGTGRHPYDSANEARVLAETETFLQRVIPEQAADILETAKIKAREKELNDAEFRIQRLGANPSATDEQIVAELGQYNFRSQLPEALKTAGRIKDPVKRAATIEILNQRR